MKIKILAAIMSLLLIICLVGCKNKNNDTTDVSSQEPPVSSEEPVVCINPLTGLKGFDQAAMQKRPVAVMINNIKTAQSVQSGLSKADIVYEAYAEGGITRLLAVFKDVSKVGNIGTVRSARYSYVDLAMGHDALYVHAGMDPTKCKAHIAETGIDNFNMLNGGPSKAAFRVKNGKALEHTLYTSGAKLNSTFAKLNYRRDLKSTASNWQDFVSEDSPITPAEGSCVDVVVNMSNSYITKFTYNKANSRYMKFSGTTAQKDISTGAQISFKNVLVLKTDVTNLSSDGYLQKTGLVGGDGYYISNGGYETIKWSKGNASSPLKITMPDGSSCKYNAGNTWVCFVDKTHSVKITGAEPQVSSANQ